MRRVEKLGSFAVQVGDAALPATVGRAPSRLRVESELYLFAPVAYCTINAAERIIDLNLEAARVLGVERARLLDKPLRVMVRSMDYPLLYSRLRRCLESGENEQFEMEVVTRAGVRLLLGIRASRLIDDAGAPGGCLLTIDDLTAKASAEQALQFLSGWTERLNGLFCSPEPLKDIAEGLVPFPATACIVSVHEPLIWKVEHGAAHAEPERRVTLAKLASADALPPTAKRARGSLLYAGEPLLVEQLGTADRVMIEKDERLQAWKSELALGSYVLLPLSLGNGHLGTVLLCRDVATVPFSGRDLPLLKGVAQRCSSALENVRLYQLAVRSARVRDEFVAMVSHDLSNALSAIQLTSSSMNQQRRASAMNGRSRTDSWQRVENAAVWMQRLIQRLLDISVIESNQLSILAAPVRLRDLIQPVLEMVQPSAEKKRVRLRLECPPDIWAQADPERIQQVLSNLLANAIKFSPVGGSVTVRVKAETRILFSVTDEGKGISAEEQEHIFDRFWQANRTRKPGVGLGLAISQGIVRAHGGTLWVESEVGRGSTFSFTLERCSAPAGALHARTKKVARIAKL